MNSEPPEDRVPVVVFAGNPNTGKSTLFNLLTHSSVPVSNYTGTTVGCHEAGLLLPDCSRAHAIDVPGTYSLAARSEDERIAIDTLLGRGQTRAPDLLVVLVDPGRLARSLYLVLQLVELRLPMVVCVNMIDEARQQGQAPDLEALEAALAVPVLGISARTGEGLDALNAHLEKHLVTPTPLPKSIHPWPAHLEEYTLQALALAGPELNRVAGEDLHRRRALGAWLLLSIDSEDSLHDAKDLPRAELLALHERASTQGHDLVAELVAMRYAWIDAHAAKFTPSASTAVSTTDRIDAWLTHPVAGLLIFLATMGALFTGLFSGSEPAIALVESTVGSVSELVREAVSSLSLLFPQLDGALHIAGDLIADGILGGVGTLIAFVPQLALLFLFIAILEDSGYLARAAQMADRLLRVAGLPGQAFVPLISGYACAVPAILATRTMPRQRDRILTMMVLPFTSCSARLPVYTLLIATTFPQGSWHGLPIRPVALFGMYLFSGVVTLVAAMVLGRTVLSTANQATILELPPLRFPHVPAVLSQVQRKIRRFLSEAGGPILLATVVLWGLLYFPHVPPPVAHHSELAQVEAPARSLENSYAGQLGHAIEPVIRPLGFDWRVGVGLVGAFAAREVFVTTMGVVYEAEASDEDTRTLRTRMAEAKWPDGSLVHTPLMGASLMIFFALALQCTSTLVVLQRETQSWRWPLLIFAYSFALAWGSSFVVYQGGRLLGLG